MDFFQELSDFCLLAATKGLLQKAIVAYVKFNAKPLIREHCTNKDVFEVS
jgi:hypothetical protein